MFIVFEGIDGCGKSTQVDKMYKYLKDLSKYNHLLVTREPYKLRDIREILKSDNNPYLKAEKLTEFFVKDRQEHIKELIKPNLQNAIIICDRYKYSTICYQAAQGQDMKKLIKMHEGMPVPDLIFIFDTSVEIAFQRMKKDSRVAEQKFEKDKDFLEKVRKNYVKLKEILPNENIIILNGNKSVEPVFSEMKKTMLSLNCF